MTTEDEAARTPPPPRPGVLIRPFRPDDTAAVYDICLRTGADGRDATGSYADPDLLGHLWAGPFLALEPQHALVLQDSDGVAGYCLAALDTRAFEAACEQRWWPALRERFPDPEGDATTWSPDQRLAHLVHHSPYSPDDVVAAFPSQLHLDLLPRAQGSGLGRRLLTATLDLLRASASAGVHLGVSPTNLRARRFYDATQFTVLRRTERVVWMGRRLRVQDGQQRQH